MWIKCSLDSTWINTDFIKFMKVEHCLEDLYGIKAYTHDNYELWIFQDTKKACEECLFVIVSKIDANR